MSTTKKPKQFAIFGVYRYPYDFDEMTTEEKDKFFDNGGPRLARTVFIGNIPYEADPGDAINMYYELYLDETCECDDRVYMDYDSDFNYEDIEYNYDVSHYINYSELKSAYRESRKRKTA